jgi:hypothetical protein
MDGGPEQRGAVATAIPAERAAINTIHTGAFQ